MLGIPPFGQVLLRGLVWAIENHVYNRPIVRNHGLPQFEDNHGKSLAHLPE